MTTRRLFALVAVAISVLSLALSVSRERTSTRAQLPVMPQLGSQFSSITQVSLRRGGAEPQVTLRRQGGSWTLAQRGDYPADSAKLRALLVALAGLRIAEEKSADPASHAALGVGDPAQAASTGTEITITLASGNRSLIIGKPAAGGNFVRDPAQAMSLLATPGITPDTEARDWIDTRLLDIPAAGIRDVMVRPVKGSAVTHPGAGYSALAGLEMADVGADTDVDWKNAVSATVTLTDGATLVLVGTTIGDHHWLKVGSAQDPSLAERTHGRAFELDAERQAAIFQP